MLLRGIEEGRDHPDAFFAAVTTDFTRTEDSNGNDWTEMADYETPIQTKVLELYEDLARQGLVVEATADVTVRSFRSRAESRTDRSSGVFAANKLRFQAGVNIATDLPKKIHASRERTHVFYEDRVGEYQTIDTDVDGNPITGVPYMEPARSETTADNATIIRMGQTFLTRRRGMAHAAVLRHIIGDGTGQYAPGPDGDYWVRDIGTIHTGTGEHDFNEEDLEVASVRFSFDEAGNPFALTHMGAQYIPNDVSRFEAGLTSAIRQNRGLQLCIPDQIGTTEAEYVLGAMDMDDNGGGGTILLTLFVTENDSALGVFVELPAGGTVTSVHWRPTAGSSTGEQAFTARATALSAPGAGNIRSYSLDSPTPGTGGSGAGQVRIVVGQDSTAAAMRVDHTTGFQDDAAATSSGAGSTSVTPGTDPGGVILAGISSANASHTQLTTGTDRAQHIGGVFDPQGLEVASQPAGAGATTTVTWSHNTGDRGMVALSFAPVGVPTLFDGHADLVGDGSRAARCSHRHHVIRDAAPTTGDDRAAGYLEGTLWVQLDDLVTPTDIVDRWLLIDEAAGVWVSVAGGGSAQFDVVGGDYRFPAGVQVIESTDGTAYIYIDTGIVEIGVQGEGYLYMDPSVGWVMSVGTGLTTRVHNFSDGAGVVLPILAADPGGGDSQAGQVYYNSASDTIRWYDGTVWADMGGGGGGGPHAADHGDGGGDELDIETLATSETDTTLVLRPNGTGGVEFDAESGGTALTVEEIDASPTETPVSVMRFPADTLTEPAVGEVVYKPVTTLTFGWDKGAAGALATTENPIDIPIQANYDIEQVTMLAVPVSGTGSAVVELAVDSYANFPPTVADKITASAPPTMSAAVKSQDGTLTGWTTSLTAGNTLRAWLTSTSGLRALSVTLKLRRK